MKSPGVNEVAQFVFQHNQPRKYIDASVKVVNSYDYCHFEVALSAEDVSLEDVDNLRKDAQRLVDKAIKQYKIAKRAAVVDLTPTSEMARKVQAIRENFPQSEWTPEQQATVKEYENRCFRASIQYDYQDDWDDWDED